MRLHANRTTAPERARRPTPAKLPRPAAAAHPDGTTSAPRAPSSASAAWRPCHDRQGLGSRRKSPQKWWKSNGAIRVMKVNHAKTWMKAIQQIRIDYCPWNVVQHAPVNQFNHKRQRCAKARHSSWWSDLHHWNYQRTINGACWSSISPNAAGVPAACFGAALMPIVQALSCVLETCSVRSISESSVEHEGWMHQMIIAPKCDASC